jgi:hypothetical protein
MTNEVSSKIRGAGAKKDAGGEGRETSTEGGETNRPALAALRETLQRAPLGAPLRSGGLWLFPILVDGPTADGPGATCTLLADALAAGTAEVTEVSDSGSVPQLIVRNRGASPILAPEGEVLVGAKQNRTVNISLLVAAHTEVVVPVSCVEAGRWQSRGRTFAAGGWAHPKLRAAKVSSVWRGGRDGLRSDQGRVWNEVAAFAADLSVPSSTSDLFESMEAAAAAEPAAAVELPPGTRGVVAAAGGKVIGVDLLASPAMLAAVWPRLWKGYAVEALRSPRPDGPGADTAPTVTRVRRFLLRVGSAARPATETPGLGEALAIDDALFAGTALVWNGAVQHVAAFTL